MTALAWLRWVFSSFSLLTSSALAASVSALLLSSVAFYSSISA